ncbi:MAG: hypothetical protein PUB75_01415 [Firmicutes bacterium]|nr:hypothetical protein [Bacillota bacterium]
MKKAIRGIVAFAVLICMSAAFAGCGGSNAPASLEAYMTEHPDLVSEIENGLKSGDDGKLAVDYSKNCCEITCTYSDTFDETVSKELAAQLEKNSDKYADKCKESIKLIENESGLKGVTISMTFVNGDGTVIWKKEYTAE